MSSHLFPSMTRERWAGVIFIAALATVLLLMAYVFGSTSSRSLRYTALFSEGKGLRVGDRVQLRGVDIGEVDHVENSAADDQVAVRLRIFPDYRDRVLANSTAFIAASAMPNDSGQMIVEVLNSTTPAPPMQNQAVIEGKDNLFEVKAWQLSGQVEEWGKNLVAASEDLRKSAKRLADDAREAAGNIAEGVTESIREGMEEALQNGFGGEGPSSVPPVNTKRGDAPTSPSLRLANPGLDATQIAEKLNEFLRELGESGSKKFTELAEKWNEIQAQLGPKIEELARSGKEFLGKQLEHLMEEIERQMEELEKNQPVPTPDQNEPVAI